MGDRRVSAHSLADEELLEAASFYEHAEAGLGASSLDEIDRALRDLVDNPESCPLVSRTVRRKLLRGFPYAVMYSLPRGLIRILAIAHVRRRPFYWSRRR